MSVSSATSRSISTSAQAKGSWTAASRSVAAASDTSALRLGSWRLESLLGEGTLTRVYRARYADSADQQSGSYAIKVLRQRWHDSPPAIARLRREAMVGRSVSDRHVISILTAHVHQAPYFVVMPCLESQTVASILAPQEKMKVSYALWVARQAAEALDALHTSGYLHGDVKPSNLFISSQGHVTLIDLGCARRLDDEPTLEQNTLDGTPAYLSPEALAGMRADARSDLYSLGVTLFQMLAGRLPWDETDIAQLIARKLSGRLPSVRSFAPHVPTELGQLVAQLTSGEPLRRPLSAREVVASLMKYEIGTLAQHLPR